MRKIQVVVKPNSRKESIDVMDAEPSETYVVRVNAPPIDGKANTRVQEMLAEYFGMPRSQILLLHGARGKKKIFQVG